MARITVLAPVPPSSSPAARAGAALRRLLRRSGIRRRHRVRVLWPVPEDVAAVLGTSDLAVHLVSSDSRDGDGYRAAGEHPGLLVLPDLDLRPVVEELVRARDPAGRVALREAEAATATRDSVPWFAHLVRRARGVVVTDEAARRRLHRAGCRTPVHVVPLDDRGSEALRRAVESTLALMADPVEWTIGRWAASLRDVGVDREDLADQGYGLRYAEALGELRTSPADGAARA
jgi:hypothetical protein